MEADFRFGVCDRTQITLEKPQVGGCNNRSGLGTVGKCHRISRPPTRGFSGALYPPWAKRTRPRSRNGAPHLRKLTRCVLRPRCAVFGCYVDMTRKQRAEGGGRRATWRPPRGQHCTCAHNQKTVTALRTGTATVGLYRDDELVLSRTITVYNLTGKYLMQSCMKDRSGMCLELNGISKANGALVIVWGKDGGSHQKFTFIKTE